MKRVNPKYYTKEYYLTGCSGFEDFLTSDGRKLDRRLQKIVEKIKKIKNKKILDIGCGRGEVVYWSAVNGASEAIGIDYSEAAIELANSVRKKWPSSIKDKTRFIKMDAKEMNFVSKSFDAIFLIEIVEHLYPHELQKVFKDTKSLLKDDGVLVVHTAPSRFFYDYTYRFWCYPISTLLVKINNYFTGNDYPNIARYSELRNDTDRIMHVNEPDYFLLRKLYNKAGLKGKIESTNVTISKPIISWKDKIYNFIVYLDPFSCRFPFNIVWGNDFISVLRKK